MKIKNNQSIPLILPVTAHTDFIGKGSTFIATKGFQLNGIDFIPLALQKGASTLIIQKDQLIPNEIKDIIKNYNPEIINVQDCRQTLSELSAKAWDYPAKKLNIIGITGTKGKTTSTFLMHHILSQAGYKTAMISGIQNIINGKIYEANLTTPLPDYLHAFFARCVQENVQYVVMEASAQAFSLKRLYGIDFIAGIFTNLDLEHLEFYPTMAEYFNAKCQMFKQIKSKNLTIINADNLWGEKILKSDNEYSSFSLLNKKSDFNIKVQDNSTTLKLLVESRQGRYIFCAPNLVGHFNAYNLAGVISLALKLDIYPKTIMDALLNFDHVPGRMEKYQLSNGALAVIDYAHNPSSFNQVLPTLKSLTKDLIVVFGCGGDRDKQKRPIMGDIASKIADKIIITSDNPRSENVDDIINQILKGISQENQPKIICEIDRKKAIEIAYSLSKSNSIIAILGKGPDEYQIFGTSKIYFSDRETILNCK